MYVNYNNTRRKKRHKKQNENNQIDSTHTQTYINTSNIHTYIAHTYTKQPTYKQTNKHTYIHTKVNKNDVNDDALIELKRWLLLLNTK